MSRWTHMSGQSNVVALSISSHAESAPQLSPLRQVEAYWSALRTDGDVPLRSAVDPRGLENILEHTFILERIAPGVARFRIAGQRLCNLAGMEVRGMPLTALLSPDTRNQMSAVLEHMFDAPAIADLTVSGERNVGFGRMSGKMILLPLKSETGAVNRTLGAFVTQGKFTKTPQRFRLGETTFRPIVGACVERPADPEYVIPDVARTPQFAEPAPEFTAKRPRLRLVHTDSGT